MMTYQDLKSELRLSNDGDSWRTCMSWWFATAAELFERGVYLPPEWQYRPSPMGAIDPDAYETPIVAEAGDDDLLRFGRLLDRYSSKLKESGKAY